MKPPKDMTDEDKMALYDLGWIEADVVQNIALVANKEHRWERASEQQSAARLTSQLAARRRDFYEFKLIRRAAAQERQQ